MSFLARVWPTLASCRTQADYYRLHLAIQQYATPDEVAVIAKSSGSFPPEFGKELRKLMSRLNDIRDDVQTCSLTPISENVSLYSGTERGRRLVFAFAGKGIGLFMPTPAVLQYLVPESCDVVVLHDPARISFAAGIFGYSDSFRGLTERLRQDLDFGAYEAVGIYGISDGGAAALAAGVLLENPTAACFSGRMPLGNAQRASRPGSHAMETLLRQAAPLSHFACIYGAGHPQDVGHATEMGKAFGTRLIPIAGVTGHNVIWELHERRELRPLFREVGLI